MAAKTAGTWVPYEPLDIADLTAHSSTQLHPLGKRCKARDVGSTGYGFGEFVYLAGVGSTVRGSVVLIKDDYTTSLVAARDKGALAVALAATVAGEYGWYQILGQGVAACDTVAANAPLYIDGTNGRVDDAVVVGDQILGMRSVTADDTNTCVVCMGTYPATADTDNGSLPVAAVPDLTDNSGGAVADGTIGAVTAPTVVTDGTMGGTANGAFETVGATNGGDVSGAIMNNFKECQAFQTAARAADVALTDAVKELSTKLNALLAGLRTAGIITP